MTQIRKYKIDEIYINDLKRKYIEFLEAEFFTNGEKLKVDGETKTVLKVLFDWVVGDYNPEKGFIIFGTYGNGKSSFMKATLNLLHHIYGRTDQYPAGISAPEYITAKNMARIFMDGETVKINKLIYSNILAVDDVGYESKEVRSFGTIVQPFEEILMERYDRKKIICLTTNRTPKQIEDKYGGHILDRLNQMCFWIEINAMSKRK